MNEGRHLILTPVEEVAVRASSFDVLYPPTEKTPTIVVENFPALGRLAALRFLEWVQSHPEGVISLPTGKTPEHFIKWVTRILGRWETKEIQELLESSGIEGSRPPDMKSLWFVQIDEFYPMDSSQQNSFHWYVTSSTSRASGSPQTVRCSSTPAHWGFRPTRRCRKFSRTILSTFRSVSGRRELIWSANKRMPSTG